MRTIYNLMLAFLVISFVTTGAVYAAAGTDNEAAKQTNVGEKKVERPNPQEMQEMTMAMAPAFGAMAQNMMDGIYTGLAKPETAKKLAIFMKNYHDALIAEGFSKEEAIQIIRAFSIPSMGGR